MKIYIKESVMHHHKGMIGLTILLFLSALMTITAAFLFYQSRSVMVHERYKNAICARYMAESGANWALGYIKRYGGKKKQITFPVGDGEVEVKIREIKNSGKEKLWEITSEGCDKKTKTVGGMILLVSVKEKGKVEVEYIKSDNNYQDWNSLYGK